MDLLSPLFRRFTMSARVFYSGALCGVSTFSNREGIGILHVLRRGRLRVTQPPAARFELTQPTLLFCRQPFVHRFEASGDEGADLVCAFVDFGGTLGNPLLRGLPDFLCVSLADMVGVESTLALLFDEAFASRPGRDAAIDRLMEYFVVLLLRHAIDARLVDHGVLAGLADTRLANAITAMHEDPQQAWSVESLSRAAGMSRARFAARFRETVGVPPLDYLTDWRISVAQTLLRRGMPFKAVAQAVGYTSAAAFSRVFARRVGVTAPDWAATHAAAEPQERH